MDIEVSKVKNKTFSHFPGTYKKVIWSLHVMFSNTPHYNTISWENIVQVNHMPHVIPLGLTYLKVPLSC